MEEASSQKIKSVDDNLRECSLADVCAAGRNEPDQANSTDGFGEATSAAHSRPTGCLHGPHDLIACLVQLMCRKSTKSHRSNELSSKHCRPNVERIIHLLKQSMLGAQDMERNGVAHECSSLIERLKRALRCHCKPDIDMAKSESHEDFEPINLGKMPDDYANERSKQSEIKSGTIIGYLHALKYEMGDACSCTTSAASPNVHHVDVLILGAGLAGLGAATVLNASKKCSFLVLEAQASAGGRIQTQPMVDLMQHDRSAASPTLIDAGAQWLHGKHNYLYHLSEKHQLLDDHQSEEGLGIYTYAHGNEIDPFLVKKIDFHIGRLLSECEQFAHSSPKMGQAEYAPESVGHFLRGRFQAYVDTVGSAEEQTIARDLFDWHVRFQMIDNSCLSLDQLSAKYWGKYSFNGESCQAHYNFTNGFGSLVDRLVADLDGPAICYDKEVHTIRIRDDRNEPNNNQTNRGDSCAQQTRRSGATISVKCADGSVYTAHHVLVTFSLGVLKARHASLFAPNVPRHVGLAIDSVGYGAINKIFLEFDAAWWDGLDGIQFVFAADECAAAGRSSLASWTRFMTGFDVMKPSHPNMLLGWVGGQGAIDMEQLSDTDIIADCIDILTKFTNIPVPYPAKFYCTRWNSNRFANGSYSFISTDCDTNATIAQRLLSQELFIDDFYASADDDNVIKGTNAHQSGTRAPIVAFAGEACHERYFSTAHGAFLSGMEQAQKFLNCYKTN